MLAFVAAPAAPPRRDKRLPDPRAGGQSGADFAGSPACTARFDADGSRPLPGMELLLLRECLPASPTGTVPGGWIGMFSAASGSSAMKRFVMASVCVLALVGVALAEEFNVTITGVKTDGNTTT